MIDFLTESWPWLLAIADIGLAVAATVHAVLWKRDSRAVIGWVGLAWLAPIVGPLLYFCFGVNRIRRKGTALKVRESWQGHRPPDLKPEEVKRQDSFSRKHPNMIGLATLGETLSGMSVLPGNTIEPLVNGDEAYPVMIDAIERAERSIALLSYIFDHDRAGDKFFEALVAAQKRGVEVRVLVDGIGGKYSKPTMAQLLGDAGLKAGTFLPTRLPRLPTANLRNHRKILVVDGKIGFTGGTNICEAHMLSLEPEIPTRCLHFSLKGPVVAHLQEAFAIDWAFASGESLAGDAWFPTLERSGDVWARGITHGPDEDFDRMTETIAGALSAACERVLIVSPYFLPDVALIHALKVTALRGVQVEIYLPSDCRIAPLQWASTAQLWQLLEKGCRVFYVPPPFDHTKLMVVDGVWSLIGSTNWDPRSLRLNFEFNVECYDEALGETLEGIIKEKAATAREVSLEEVNARGLPTKLRDGLARLLSPYL